MKFECYSPGVSPIVFHWTEGNHSVSKAVLPSRIQRYLTTKGQHFVKQGFRIHKIENRWTILRHVVRIDHETLKTKNWKGESFEFRYRILHLVKPDREIWPNDIRVEFWQDVKNIQRWHQMLNISILNSIAIFLRYEDIWEQTLWAPGKKIKNDDTWRVEKEFQPTTFLNGDGYTPSL